MFYVLYISCNYVHTNAVTIDYGYSESIYSELSDLVNQIFGLFKTHINSIQNYLVIVNSSYIMNFGFIVNHFCRSVLRFHFVYSELFTKEVAILIKNKKQEFAAIFNFFFSS